MKLRLLALVLALALTWYALNPAPGPVRRDKRDEEIADEEQRAVKSAAGEGYDLEPAEAVDVLPVVESRSAGAELSVEELEWPEFIALR